MELYAIVNRQKPLNIFAKKLHLVFLLGFLMPLCLLVVSLPAKKDILRLGKLIDKEHK